MKKRKLCATTRKVEKKRKLSAEDGTVDKKRKLNTKNRPVDKKRKLNNENGTVDKKRKKALKKEQLKVHWGEQAVTLANVHSSIPGVASEFFGYCDVEMTQYLINNNCFSRL
jgi:hypothetical protein